MRLTYFSEPVSLLNASALIFPILPVNWKVYLTVAVICTIVVSSVSLSCQGSCIYTSVNHLLPIILIILLIFSSL